MEELIGRQFGSYRLVRLLGQGSFAEVYLGEHIHLGTQAAIKILYTQLATRDTEQFRAEAQTIARLEHPHIVRILDFGVEGTTPFLAMGYAPHGSLRDCYPKGTRLPLPTIISYVKQIADALQYAHNEKVVHRDIKPENILLGRRNEIVLADFGIALIVQSSQSRKDMAGTVAYMAPEQIEAHPRPASDQYALGIVVYEWLCGERPFQGTFTEIALKQHMVSPPPLRDRVPDLPRVVEQTVMRALAKDPQQRFPCVQDFASALEQASRSASGADTPLLIQGVELAHPASTNLTELRTQPLSAEEIQKTKESAQRSQKMLSAPAHPASALPLSTTHSGESASLPAVATPPGRPPAHKRASSVMMLLLIGGALLMIIGSGALFFMTNIFSAQQTQAAKATLQVYTRTTRQAQVAATATTQASLAAGTATAMARPNPYAPQQANLVIDDPLKDNSQGHGWEQGENCQFSNNTYHALAQPGFGKICSALSTQFTDLTYEVNVSFLKGQQGESSTGTGAEAIIVIRGTNSRDGYYFSVLMNGSFILYVCQGDNCARSLFPKNACCGFASSFHQGLNVTNRLAITVQGNTFSAYINGQRVLGPVNDDLNAYTSGTIGLGAVGGDTPTDAAFTNATVWTD